MIAGIVANSRICEISMHMFSLQLSQWNFALPLPALLQQRPDLFLQRSPDLPAVASSPRVVQAADIIEFQKPRNKGKLIIDSNPSPQSEQFDECGWRIDELLMFIDDQVHLRKVFGSGLLFSLGAVVSQ